MTSPPLPPDIIAIVERVGRAVLEGRRPDPSDAATLADHFFGPDTLSGAERLDLVRWLRRVARWLPAPPPLPRHELDQFEAAEADVLGYLGRVPAVEPDRDWRLLRPLGVASAAQEDLLRAALLDCRRCPHLKAARGAQPVFVRLAARWMDCERCACTTRHPRPGEADRCDLCGARGVTEFWPLRLGAGHLLVLGDVCPGCHRVLVGAPA
jgi:hypothetical protein